ncbi:MAG: SDR family oxidoreductase [bacterium]
MHNAYASNIWDLQGKTIVVPGGGGMLGKVVCLALVREGANVVILARSPSKLSSFMESLGDLPGRGVVLEADVLEREKLFNARNRIQEKFGEVYGLLNFAGGNVPEATTSVDRRFFDLPEDALRYAIELNLLGTVFPCQVFGSLMAQASLGVIINVASMAGYRPLTRTVAYSAAKAAVANFTQWLAVHMAKEYSAGIRVNAVAPGFFHTTQNHYLLYDEATGDLTPRGKSIIAHTPMGRFGEPEDLVGAVLWLLSPLSKFVTGAVIPVDGGFSAFSGV